LGRDNRHFDKSRLVSRPRWLSPINMEHLASRADSRSLNIPYLGGKQFESSIAEASHSVLYNYIRMVTFWDQMVGSPLELASSALTIYDTHPYEKAAGVMTRPTSCAIARYTTSSPRSIVIDKMSAGFRYWRAMAAGTSMSASLPNTCAADKIAGCACHGAISNVSTC
jgi:hypothetical protein